MSTAIFIDAAFFLKRFTKVYPNKDVRDAALVAKTLHEMALGHVHGKRRNNSTDVPRDLYRIFVYDCPPLQKKVHYPVSKKALDFKKSDAASFRLKFHDELKKLRKVALRLGQLHDGEGWQIKPSVTKDLLAQRRSFPELGDDDFVYEVRQKGVDMKIGLDIASIAYKHLVDQMVLISGDADFVPAAKLARREGIDFILDPMWHTIHDDLHEHIDGLKSLCPRPIKHKTASSSDVFIQ